MQDDAPCFDRKVVEFKGRKEGGNAAICAAPGFHFFRFELRSSNFFAFSTTDLEPTYAYRQDCNAGPCL
eukprot:293182-Amphidinium_carterae.2